MEIFYIHIDYIIYSYNYKSVYLCIYIPFSPFFVPLGQSLLLRLKSYILISYPCTIFT